LNFAKVQLEEDLPPLPFSAKEIAFRLWKVIIVI
jgi:hypothetical protein